MIRRGLLGAVALLALAVRAGPINAQHVAPMSSETSVCLSLGDALTLGAQLGPEVATAQARLAGAEASLTEARSLLRPQVSGFVRSAVGDTGLIDSRVENQVGVRASQRIFDFGDARYARESARANVAARAANVAEATAAASETIGLSYLGWLETQDRLTATRDREQFFAQQLKATGNLLDTGGATIADVARIESEMLDAQAARIELEFLLERFATLLEIGTKRANLPCDAAKTSTALAALAPDLAQAPALISTSPAIVALQRSADSFTASATRAERGRYPIISLTGISSFAVESLSNPGSFRNRIGVDVSVPLYSGQGQTARIALARARAREAEGQLAQARRKLEEELSIGVRRVTALGRLLERRREAVRNRRAELAAAEAQFGRGLRTLPELIEVRVTMEEAELARITTAYDLARQQLRLYAIAGAAAAN